MLFLLLVLAAAPAAAQMDLKQVSGQPLPSADLPAGTMTVRVVRGGLTNNVPNQPVQVTVDGSTRTLTTDAGGRVEVTGLKPGARVKVVTTVDGERVESQDITIGSGGIRVMLAAGLADAAASAGTAAAAAPVSGTVAFGRESRIVAEFADDRLSVYYLMDIVNPAKTPVDIGGPLILDLPREARGATLMQDSSPKATLGGPRVTVVGPFAPGTTSVRVAFELPTSGGRARISSKLPAALPELVILVGQLGGLDLESPQITAKRNVVDQGLPILAATGPALQAGQTLDFEITGLPHHPVWPRNLALALAGSIMVTGIWAAVAAGPRRRRKG